ncbi:16S rRNA (guanine(966)-N(2))-methyltransferase RsmD [Rickettsia endosymbiont of Rhinocyllus conicus]|uniref:16S rRNA (guanine(966)-N(2))-methyltransferase RsmD n=1 Tax=Rickettsia endosymbiont of Rhinocyllus conicus TaxID=3066252 RepID=UPI003132FCEF
MLKIISGKFQNQKIPIAKNIKYRPSTGKLKEAIFSILTSGEFIGNKLFNENIKVLDLFAGSGSLAFESLSRGAGFATLIDIDLYSLKIAEEFAKTLNIQDKVNFVNINALNLPKANTVFDLIFVDPPYHNKIVPKVMKLLIKNNWLNTNAIIVVEMSKTDDYVLDENIEIIREKLYGNTKLLVLKYNCHIVD